MKNLVAAIKNMQEYQSLLQEMKKNKKVAFLKVKK